MRLFNKLQVSKITIDNSPSIIWEFYPIYIYKYIALQEFKFNVVEKRPALKSKLFILAYFQLLKFGNNSSLSEQRDQPSFLVQIPGCCRIIIINTNTYVFKVKTKNMVRGLGIQVLQSQSPMWFPPTNTLGRVCCPVHSASADCISLPSPSMPQPLITLSCSTLKQRMSDLSLIIYNPSSKFPKGDCFVRNIAKIKRHLWVAQKLISCPHTDCQDWTACKLGNKNKIIWNQNQL